MTKQELIINDERYVPLHDHGFVGLIDTMGSDADICQAARVSYGVGTKSVSDDRNLIRYLVRHAHTSPLEMAEVKFHIKTPIFIMRQLVRHRTANLNEYSARYSVLSSEFYVPEFEYIASQSQTNRQGRAGTLSNYDKNVITESMFESMRDSHSVYQTLLGEIECDDFSDEYPGVSRELARIVTPVATYTECYWKCDLHNLFHFLRLRMDSHAQREIVDLATAMYKLVKSKFPLACEAFEDYQFHAKTLSRMDCMAVRDMIAGKFRADPADYNMSKREYSELVDLFGISSDHSRNLIAS